MFTKLMDKQNVIYPHNGLLLSHENEQTGGCFFLLFLCTLVMAGARDLRSALAQRAISASGPGQVWPLDGEMKQHKRGNVTSTKS